MILLPEGVMAGGEGIFSLGAEHWLNTATSSTETTEMLRIG